ncbi:MAG: hypothetical protein ACPGVG_16080, partial [Mycobacterium sp.]
MTRQRRNDLAAPQRPGSAATTWQRRQDPAAPLAGNAPMFIDVGESGERADCGVPVNRRSLNDEHTASRRLT